MIAPFGLVAKGRVWYLVGSVDGHVRSYRVSGNAVSIQGKRSELRRNVLGLTGGLAAIVVCGAFCARHRNGRG